MRARQPWIVLSIVMGIAAIAVATVLIRSQGSDAGEPQQDGIEFNRSGGQSSGQPVQFGAGDGRFASSPRQLTAAECTEAARRMEAQAQMLAAAIEKQDGDKSLLRAQLAAAIAESRGWLRAGCPEHPVLGYYPALDGSGALKSILIEFP